MILLEFGDSMRAAVPPRVAKCPECGALLEVEVIEWESETGKPTGEGGIHVVCTREEKALDDYIAGEMDEALYRSDYEERGWQSEWQPVCTRVARWAEKNVRVEPHPAAERSNRDEMPR